MNASATKRLTVSSGDSDRAAGGLGGLPPSHGSGRGRIDRPSRLLERGEPLSSSPMKEGLAPSFKHPPKGRETLPRTLPWEGGDGSLALLPKPILLSRTEAMAWGHAR